MRPYNSVQIQCKVSTYILTKGDSNFEKPNIERNRRSVFLTFLSMTKCFIGPILRFLHKLKNFVSKFFFLKGLLNRQLIGLEKKFHSWVFGQELWHPYYILGYPCMFLLVKLSYSERQALICEKNLLRILRRCQLRLIRLALLPTSLTFMVIRHIFGPLKLSPLTPIL